MSLTAWCVRFGEGGCDYVSNTRPPTFPDGLDVEVFSFDALHQAWSEAVLPSEREHVTPYLRTEKFRSRNVANEHDYSRWRWTVDEARDLEFVRAIYARFAQHLDLSGRM
jgi:spore coat polysaccharide biosynthesis protein SpsF (cytidylyltransferase family)